MHGFYKMIEKIVEQEIVDLSYTLEPGMPVWSSHARFGAIVYETYDEGDVSYHRQVSYGEHTGTHIDAPRHFFREGAAIDHVKVKAVMGRGVCIDASFLKPCEEYTLDMLKAFEAEYGEIQEGDVILSLLDGEEKYAIGKKGEEFLKDWLHEESAAKYLADKKVASVGTDALALGSIFSAVKSIQVIKCFWEWDSNLREPDKSEKDSGIFLYNRSGK